MSLLTRSLQLLPMGLMSFLSAHTAMAADEESFRQAREAMVSQQIEARGVRDPAVLRAMRKVPRHLYVPEESRHVAYRDTPLPIGQGQTISQPYIVALMTELVRPRAADRVLEVGTGSGYQAAVLAEIVERVHTIELEPELARSAERVLKAQSYEHVTVRAGDGYVGWAEVAPFDIIVVTAAPDHIPQPLLDQLKPGGRMVVPVGPVYATQQLRLLQKDAAGKIKSSDVTPVRFVPLRRKEQ
jgi:protein-L-isoaspartate(D-aspartate) O-methyltransferase